MSHTGDKLEREGSVCKCMDCAAKRQARRDAQVRAGKPEEYSLTLDGAEAKWLALTLGDLARDPIGSNSRGDVYSPAKRILETLGYSAPRFRPGAKVRRVEHDGTPDEDSRVYTVVRNEFVAPGVWTDWLDAGFGVGEAYLRAAPDYDYSLPVLHKGMN